MLSAFNNRRTSLSVCLHLAEACSARLAPLLSRSSSRRARLTSSSFEKAVGVVVGSVKGGVIRSEGDHVSGASKSKSRLSQSWVVVGQGEALFTDQR